MSLDARFMLIMFDDQVQDRLDGTMLAGQLGGSWKFSEVGRFRLLVEESSTSLQPHWLRVFGIVDLNLWM